MKRHLFNVAGILFNVAGILVVMLTAGSASAQTAKQLSASVPFDFTVGQKTFPAGKYTIYRTSVNTTDGFLLPRRRRARGSGLQDTRGAWTGAAGQRST